MNIYQKFQKNFVAILSVAAVSAAFVLSGCETDSSYSKKPGFPIDSAIMKGKKEGRR